MAQDGKGRVGVVATSSSQGGEIYDRVFVRDLVLDVEIGVYTNEKGVTQRVRFSVDVDVRQPGSDVDDQIDREKRFSVAAIAIQDG